VFLVQLGNRLKLKVKKLLSQLDQSKCHNHNDHMIRVRDHMSSLFEKGMHRHFSVCKPKTSINLV
jgi:intergrase/recombinase